MSLLADSTESTLNSNNSTFDENEKNVKINEVIEPNTNKNCLQKVCENNQGLVTTFILFSLAFLNVADRYIVSSVLLDVQAYYQVSKSTAGLLQTIFLLFYMAFAPLNGYLGDRINRKYLLVTSILIWITSTIGGSFVDHKHFFLFVLSRCLFGIATASFETIGVPIIGDRSIKT